MSGGIFNYEDVKFRMMIEDFTDKNNKNEVKENLYNEDLQINLIEYLNKASLILCDFLHDVDWHLSGDSKIHNQEEFLNKYKEKFLELSLNEKTLKYFKN